MISRGICNRGWTAGEKLERDVGGRYRSRLTRERARPYFPHFSLAPYPRSMPPTKHKEAITLPAVIGKEKKSFRNRGQRDTRELRFLKCVSIPARERERERETGFVSLVRVRIRTVGRSRMLSREVNGLSRGNISIPWKLERPHPISLALLYADL